MAVALTDPELENIDPTPSIFDLFRQFNVKFFWSKLDMVEVSWSGRQMTSCAGVCSFHPRTGYCQIRLSAPLLSLRPRKDLVETLLHEMIHAYLFMTRNNKDRSDHGPEFHKHMYRINNAAGTNISVFHTFNDEVRSLQKHVWRCDGPCQKRSPFFGVVRRANNRAPGPNDTWWDKHRMDCSGVFQKIEEPPGYKKKGVKGKEEKKIPKSSNDLRNFFTPSKNPGATTGKIKGTAAKVPKVPQLTSGKPPPTFSSNVHTLGNTGIHNGTCPNRPQSSSVPKPANKTNIHTFSSVGGRITGTGTINRGTSTVLVTPKPVPTLKNTSETKTKTVLSPSTSSQPSARDHVRNIWANKPISVPAYTGPKETKRPAPLNDGREEAKRARKSVESKSSDVILECPDCERFVPEKDLESHSCRRENPQNLTEECPVCQKLVSNIQVHLESCLDKSFDGDDPFTDTLQPKPSSSKNPETHPCLVCNKPVAYGGLGDHLSQCLNESVAEDFYDDFVDTGNSGDEQSGNSDSENVTCPVCCEGVASSNINAHVDECLTLHALSQGSF